MAGWAAPDDETLPTGAQLVEDYLQPLAKLPAIAGHLRFGARVTAMARVAVDRVRTDGRVDQPLLQAARQPLQIAEHQASAPDSEPQFRSSPGRPSGRSRACGW